MKYVEMVLLFDPGLKKNAMYENSMIQEDDYFRQIKANINNKMFILVFINVGVPWIILIRL